MPTSFASYDLDQSGTISPEEWQQFYALDQGPASEPPVDPNAPPPAPFDFQTFLDRVSNGSFTDDDMLAFSNWYMGQQMAQQGGQLDLANRTLDFQLRSLGLNEQQLETAKQEIEFKQGPYWDWYVEDYFPHQQQRDQWEYDLAGLNLDTQRYMSDNQKAIADIEKGKAKDYAQAQMYGTEQSKYGADAARWQYLQMLQTPRPTTGRSLGAY